jgi:hypothetical protein
MNFSLAMSGISLGQRLGPLFQHGFFRLLARRSAPLYVDCAESLDEASDEGGQIAHDEAIAIIREAVIMHPSVQLDPDEGGAFSDLRQKAGQIFNQLLAAKWLEERSVSLDERFVVLSPRLGPLLTLLRELAEQDLAELKDFAATVRSICETLLADGAMDPTRKSPEELRQTAKELLDRVRRAGQQMRALEGVILKYSEEQRASASPGETLQRFLVDFHEGDHMVCYDTLERGGLLPKLKQARLIAMDALADPLVKKKLADGVAQHRSLDESSAYGEAEEMLSRLERSILGLSTKQRIIDARIGDFSRLSAARYRYQTEMRGRKPELVRAHLSAANEQYSGLSFAHLSREPGMRLLSPMVETFFGIDALARPRRARLAVDLNLAGPSGGEDSAEALERIRRQNLYAVTPQRAARFLEKYLPRKGDRVSTENMEIRNEDDLLDLMAVLAYERASTGSGRRQIRWRIEAARAEFGLEPEKIPTDVAAGRRVERVTVERVA